MEGGVEVSSVKSVVGRELSIEAAGGKLELVGGGGSVWREGLLVGVRGWRFCHMQI